MSDPSLSDLERLKEPIENEVMKSQSRSLSERDGSVIQFDNKMDSGLDYP